MSADDGTTKQGQDGKAGGAGGEDAAFEPTYAAKMIGKLREHIETGQLNIGAGGPGSNNAIVNPLRAAAAAAAQTANNGELDAEKKLAADNASSVGVVQTAVPVSPRTAHAAASNAYAEQRAKKRIAEEARHKKEREDKLTRYLVLIICIIVIILSILAMAAISRRVIGKWWYGQPDPLENTQPSDKITHVPLFPGTSK